jgi:hypothetical protein
VKVLGLVGIEPKHEGIEKLQRHNDQKPKEEDEPFRFPEGSGGGAGLGNGLR